VSAVVEPTRWQRVKAWLDVRFRSPAAIYGLIVFTTFVTLADDEAHDVAEVLLNSTSTLIVFFIAHVFAHTLTEHGEHGLRGSTRNAMRHAAGMLYASVPSILALVFGILTHQSVSDAVDNCITAMFVVLAILGYQAFRRRGYRVFGRLMGALATSFLGIVIVILEIAVH
jgi:hypothetical protein